MKQDGEVFWCKPRNVPELPDQRGVTVSANSCLIRALSVCPLAMAAIVEPGDYSLRCGRSAAYRSVWLPEGSPLLVFTCRLAKKLAARAQGQWQVETGMRYGKPSIRSALADLRDGGVKLLTVLPLYPQFSGTTTLSIYDAVDQALREMNWQPEVQRINDYHLHPAWVAAVASSIVEFRARAGTAEKLVFSLHGIPQRYVANGDPYEQQCRAGVTAIARAAQLKDDEWLLTFQSRVGREPWLMPYTI
jgi:ferrochelatase